MEKYLYEQLEKHSSEVRILRSRILSLEKRSIFTDHLTKLHQIKLDDQEQFSRKINLVINGIEAGENEHYKRSR